MWERERARAHWDTCRALWCFHLLRRAPDKRIRGEQINTSCQSFRQEPTIRHRLNVLSSKCRRDLHMHRSRTPSLLTLCFFVTLYSAGVFSLYICISSVLFVLYCAVLNCVFSVMLCCFYLTYNMFSFNTAIRYKWGLNFVRFSFVFYRLNRRIAYLNPLFPDKVQDGELIECSGSFKWKNHSRFIPWCCLNYQSLLNKYLPRRRAYTLLSRRNKFNNNNDEKTNCSAFLLVWR